MHIYSEPQSRQNIIFLFIIIPTESGTDNSVIFKNLTLHIKFVHTYLPALNLAIISSTEGSGVEKPVFISKHSI